MADARRNFHHQLPTRLIRENQAIAVEDLAVTALARTRPAKSVHDAGWASFVNMLAPAIRRRSQAARLSGGGRCEPDKQL